MGRVSIAETVRGQVRGFQMENKGIKSRQDATDTASLRGWRGESSTVEIAEGLASDNNHNGR